jgi:hypothetical protein
MSIPASGPISMSMFNTELGRTAAVANTRFANGTVAGVGSIIYLAGESGSNPPDQNAPHAFSEMYGYTADLTTRVYVIELQTNSGAPGVCVGTGTFEIAEFTVEIPSQSVAFTEDAGLTVYKRISSTGYLNSGSTISFGAIDQIGVVCNT